MDIIKIALIGIVISIIAVFLKTVKSEYATLCVLVGGIIILIYILNSAKVLVEFFGTIVDRTGVDKDLFTMLLKIIGVGYIVEFSAGLCNDTGNSSLSSKIALSGKILIFVISMPVIKNLFELIMGLI